MLMIIKLITNKKAYLRRDIVYDILASTPVPRTPHNSLRVGPNVNLLIYDTASGFEGTDDGAAVRPCQNKTLSTWINRISFKNPNSSEPDTLSNCSTNGVLEDLNHKPKIETESEIPQNRHRLKQSIKILGNGDNALYRLGDKMYLLERIEF